MILTRHLMLILPIVISAGLAGCSSQILPEGKLQPMKFFEKQDASTPGLDGEASFGTSAPVTPEDLVDASGACAASAVAAAPAPAQDSATGTIAGDLGSQNVQSPPVLGGVALGMTECQVVQRAGQPGKVEISADPNNDRATVLTYMTGPWPGIYKFSVGRLKEVERVAEPPPPKLAKKPVKKKKAVPKAAAQ
jgi:hypothetical protein